MAQLRNYFLGSFWVTRDDKNVIGFESDKMRALLAYLIVEADRPHQRESLAALLWPDQTDTAARQSLRQALYVVRQALDRDQGSGIGDQGSGSHWTPLIPDPRSPIPTLLVTRQTVQFNRESDTWCDVWLFDDLLAACEAHSHNHSNPGHPDRCIECVERLQRAVELYRGDFLQGFVVNDSREFEEWAILEREKHHRLMMHALGRLADYHEAVGEHEQALRFVMWQLKLEPWREESHRQAMSLLSRTGQRSAALAQYETCRYALAMELGLEPARETTALFERISMVNWESGKDTGSRLPPSDSEVRPHDLPIASTPLIGREAEVTAVVELLLQDNARVLTITGPGGVGKTRIAMQAALDSQEHFAHSAYFVNLAPINDPSLVAAEIASTLGVKEAPDKNIIESLIAYLQAKQVLLLLDNFEQVAEAAPLITRLIQGTSGVKVLATSRVALGLRGTQEFLIAPMSLPDRVQLPDLERVAGYEAIRLFVTRAAAVKPGFEITGENVEAIVEICHRLDGLPLAIELAAARIKVLPPKAMLARLQSRLELIASKDRDVPTRQQTLRNTIEWSYDLLDEGEKQLFRRMAVFQGGRTLEGIEAVCDKRVRGEGRGVSNPNQELTPRPSPLTPLGIDVLEGVESLVSKSLLQQREGSDGEARFWMLETIHEYAREKLEESGEVGALQRAHARYYMELAEEAEPQLAGARQSEWLVRLEEDHDNIREALRWAREIRDQGSRSLIWPQGQELAGIGAMGQAGDAQRSEAVEIGLRIAGALWRFWYVRGYPSEGREQLASVLSSGTVVEEMKAIRAKALAGAGSIAWLHGDYASARSLIEDSLAIKRELGDKKGIAASVGNLGIVAYLQGDYVPARTLLKESLVISRELGEKVGIGTSLHNVAMVAYAQGDYVSARVLYEESLAISRELENKVTIATTLRNLGRVAYAQGDYTSASSMYKESLDMRRELGDKGGISTSLNYLGNLAFIQGDYALARSTYEESLDMRRELGDKGGVAETLNNLGHLAHRQGDVTRARQQYLESLSISREIGARQVIAVSLAGLGSVACTAQQSAIGVRLLGAAEALLEVLAAVEDPVDRAEYEQGVATARAQLEDEAFAAAWIEGRIMSVEEAIAYALEVGK